MKTTSTRRVLARESGDLRDSDKRAIDAFADHKAYESRSGLLRSDGTTLTKFGLGGQEIAHWAHRTVVVTAVMDSRSTQAILRYLRKVVPADQIKNENDPRGPRGAAVMQNRTIRRYRRAADEQYEAVIDNQSYGPGKYEGEGAVGEWVHNHEYMDFADGFGDVAGFGGYYTLLSFDKPVLVKETDGSSWTFQAVIAEETSQGFVNFDYFDTVAEAEARYEEIEEEYGEWLEEVGDDYY